MLATIWDEILVIYLVVIPRIELRQTSDHVHSPVNVGTKAIYQSKCGICQLLC